MDASRVMLDVSNFELNASKKSLPRPRRRNFPEIFSGCVAGLGWERTGNKRAADAYSGEVWPRDSLSDKIADGRRGRPTVRVKGRTHPHDLVDGH